MKKLLFTICLFLCLGNCNLAFTKDSITVYRIGADTIMVEAKTIMFKSEKVGKETKKTKIKQTDKNYNYMIDLDKCGGCSFDKKNTLVYDFSCKLFYYNGSVLKKLKNIPVKHDELFRVAVTNVNRYLYDVEINTDNIEYTSQMPALFNQLFLGIGNPISGLVDMMLSVEMSNLNASDSGLSKIEKSEPLMDSLKSKLIAFKIKYDLLIDQQLTAYQYCTVSLKCCGDNSATNYSSMASDLLQLKLLYKKYTAETDDNIAKSKKDLDCITEKEKQLLTIKTETSRAKKDSIQKLIDKLDCKINLKDSLIETLKTLETNKEMNDEIYDAITKISEEDLMKLILFTHNMVNNHLTYIAPPIYPRGNLLDIGIKIKPSDTGQTSKWRSMPLDSDSSGISLFVKNKFYVSFSTGPFAAFGSSSKFAQQTYSWQQKFDTDSNGLNIVSDTSRYNLVESSSNRSLFGIGAFAHFGVRLKKNFGIAATTGVGVTFEKKPIPVYFLGGSLFMGADWHQFNISFGVALAQLKVKSSTYRDDVLYDSKPADIDYGHKLGVGGFISISYTLLSPETVGKNKAGSK